MLAPILSPAAVVSCLAAATSPQSVALVVGLAYELRTTADVWVRPGSGMPGPSDQRVRPDSPLVFVADVSSASFLASTASDAVVTIRPMRPVSSPSSSGCGCGCR
jgi:hypothetical protein